MFALAHTKLGGVASVALAALLAIGFAGCSGDDGAAGPAGPAGAAGTPGAPGAPGAPGTPGTPATLVALESCGVCHDDGSYVDASARHAIDREITFAVTAPPVNDAGVLVVGFNIKVNGANYDGFTNIQRSVVFNGVAGDYTRYDLRDFDSITSTGSGNYEIRVTNSAGAYVGTDSRYYFRLQSADGTRRASVYTDDASYARLELVSNTACQNCHGTFAGGLTSHHYNPFNVEACVACHSAVNPSNGYSLVNLVHGIHSAHDRPSGHFDLDGEIWETTYPTYMNNCSVCHDDSAKLAAANSMAVSPANCFSCHENMTGLGSFASSTFHLSYDETTDCASACHSTGGVVPTLAKVADFHNGDTTGNGGVIWNGADTSVTEGAKFDWKITGVVDNGTTLAISWTANYNTVGVNPCNATVGAGAPGFHAATGSNLSILYTYMQGEDPIRGTSNAPGQADSVNLSTTNTTCASNVATTTITPNRVAGATVARIALQGKPRVVSAASPTATMQVRAKTPTYDFLVGSGDPAPARRAIADTGQCLKCHVGSLYQHGGNRVDNVDMCILCHNSASNDKFVRVGMGVDATEAYDGKVGQTFEMKTMLHAIHSAGEAQSGGDVNQAPIAIYRNRGIYYWGLEEPANWPDPVADACVRGTTAGLWVYGADRTVTNACQPHNFHKPTFPRLENDCGACHAAGFGIIPDQTKAMATTLDAGADPWTNQIDDVLQGAGAAACTSCHSDAATKGHANQNGWAPQVFPNGRQSIIDDAN